MYFSTVKTEAFPLLSWFGKSKSEIPPIIGWEIKPPPNDILTVDSFNFQNNIINLHHASSHEILLKQNILKYKNLLVQQQQQRSSSSIAINWLQNHINQIISKGDKKYQRGFGQFLQDWVKHNNRQEPADIEWLDETLKKRLADSYAGIKSRPLPNVNNPESSSSSRTITRNPIIPQQFPEEIDHSFSGWSTTE